MTSEFFFSNDSLDKSSLWPLTALLSYDFCKVSEKINEF